MRWTAPLLLCVLPACHSQPASGNHGEADEVAVWLDDRAEVRAETANWPIDPEADQPAYSPNLYSGGCGVLLFYLEHYAQTGRAGSLEMAKAAGEGLLDTLPELSELGTGLYTGAAGIGFALEELYRSSGEQRYHLGSLAVLDFIMGAARRNGDRASWGPVTDIISGDAGIGLYLLWAAGQMQRPQALELSRACGRHLLSLAEPRESGLAWQMAPGYAREMPGFSHGTAGIAYFLARLFQETGDESFLEAAESGARYLESLSDARGLIYHNQTSPDLFYLGWCHGPAGTARLFDLLDQITGNPSWERWIARAGRSMSEADMALQRPPGFWNTHGQCCGSAGLAEFYLDHAEAIGRERSQHMLQELTAQIRRDRISMQPGSAWKQAEHRARPEELSIQTGYAQGAAGIGMFFLHLNAEQKGRSRRIILPDANVASPR
ncbi:MAG: lanthionine synthetase LanC family protein [Planctomycetota bacterium]|jgi:lantibiotic modifying enzyme